MKVVLVCLSLFCASTLVPTTAHARALPPAWPELSPAPPARGGVRIAVTIDDVPWTGSHASPDEIADGTKRMIAVLTEFGVSATAFVACGRAAEGFPNVRRWKKAGFELGNHSTRHRDLNNVQGSEWLSDITTCHEQLSEIDEPRYFRYPFLHRGDTVEKRLLAANWIVWLGYEVAPVTIDNSEWVYARRYVDAVRAHDEKARARIAKAYKAHLRRAVKHAVQVARERVGRDVAHILLLHANRLNADLLGGVLDALVADGARFIRLAEALEDPVYALEDDYIGEQGLSWLYRIPPAMPELAAWDEAEEQRAWER